MQDKPVIAVIGDAYISQGDPREEFSNRLGELIIDAGWRIQTGGMGGVMEAACKGARKSQNWQQGDIIALLPGHDPHDANPFCDVAIPTGLGHARNMLVVHCSAVIAVGGGPGTLSEIAFAWLSNKLIVAKRGTGWAGKLADTVLDERRKRLPSIDKDRIYGADKPEEVINLIKELLPVYSPYQPTTPRRIDLD